MISEHMNNAVIRFKNELENAIITGENVNGEQVGGLKAKESFIRSSRLINHIHDAIKKELVDEGIDESRLLPPIGQMAPELNLAGFLKKKKQDVTVTPEGIEREQRFIKWGPLQFEESIDANGQEYSEKCLVINVRSQMSSLAKNADTLFERTFAEPLNLHLVYPKLVLGEVYMIPLKEYDETKMSDNKIEFKNRNVNVLKYISFFNAVNGRISTEDDLHKYERCALMIVDFSRDIPKIYSKHQELIDDHIIPAESNINYDDISIDSFSKEILRIYNERFYINH